MTGASAIIRRSVRLQQHAGNTSIGGYFGAYCSWRHFVSITMISSHSLHNLVPFDRALPDRHLILPKRLLPFNPFLAYMVER